MNRRDYFIAAMMNRCYASKDWVLSAFTLREDDGDAWQENAYNYQIVQSRSGYFYVMKEGMIPKLVPFDQTNDKIDLTKPLFDAQERLFITQEDVTIPLVSEERNVETTYGNVFYNYLVFAEPFKGKIPYQNRRVMPDYAESLIRPRLVDDPAPGEHVEMPNLLKAPIFMKEYLAFTKSMFFLTGLTQVWVPADTAKSITPPPGVAEYKKRLLEEYKDQLKDPAIIALIDKKLIEFDAAYLKGDDSEGFLISKKSRNTVRRKLYLMTGAEQGLDEGVAVDLVPNSLNEGWDKRYFPQLNNTQRAGSFNRGAQTELGGVAVKWLQRASANLKIAGDDCGTRLGMATTFTDKNIKKYKGFSVVTSTGHEVLTDDNMGSYLGKTMMVRSPMFCTYEKTDYCRVCCGPTLSLNETAMSAAVSAYGSAFMSIFMKSAHAKDLVVEHMDFNDELM